MALIQGMENANKTRVRFGWCVLMEGFWRVNSSPQDAVLLKQILKISFHNPTLPQMNQITRSPSIRPDRTCDPGILNMTREVSCRKGRTDPAPARERVAALFTIDL